MKGSNSSFALAAGLSLAIHATLVVILLRTEPTPAGNAWVRGMEAEQRPVVVEPEPEALPEPEPVVLPPPEFEMGDVTGKGDATHDLKDPKEAIAPEAEADQAFLSLDPAGTGEHGSDAAVAKANGQGSVRGQPGGGPQRPVAEAEAMETPAPPSIALMQFDTEMKRPRVVSKMPDSLIGIPTNEAKPEPRPDEVATTAPAAPQPPEPPTPAAPKPVAVAVAPAPKPQPAPTPSPAIGGASLGGAQQPAADPARMAESESDPFSRLGTVTFSEGALQIRFGRKVKTRKPKLLIAGQIDLLSRQRATVVLKIDIDATGKVTSVNVVKSSGSNEIDQPTRVAVYDWWFEPKKDAKGIAVADEVQFTIGWR